jgi:hypothetical protein
MSAYDRYLAWHCRRSLRKLNRFVAREIQWLKDFERRVFDD